MGSFFPPPFHAITNNRSKDVVRSASGVHYSLAPFLVFLSLSLLLFLLSKVHIKARIGRYVKGGYVPVSVSFQDKRRGEKSWEQENNNKIIARGHSNDIERKER